MKTYHAGVMLAAALILVSGPVRSADDPKVAAEVMSLARAQWAAESAGKSIAEQSASTADDYTEFNADYPARIEGKALSDRLAEASSKDGSKSLVGEMANPKVQVYGDTAILTYNFVGMRQDKDGKVMPAGAKSTRVYARMNGKWMLVHANFAPVVAAP
jgi:ketosteroid isomerase-like protein